MTQIHYGYGGPISESTVPVATPDGDDLSSIWFDEYGRQVHRSTNVAIGATDVSDVAPAKMQILEWTWAQLTTAVPTYTAAVNVEVYDLLQLQIVVAAIDTSVDVQAQGSLDNASWYNLDDAEVDTQYVANGTYQMHCDNRKNKYVRFGAMAEVGGANVTLDVKGMAGN